MTTQPKAKKKRRGTQPLDAPQALVGRVLDGRFRLNEVLTRGGMGIVFEATQIGVNRRIAVKILRPTLAGEADLVQRFSQEIEVVASLSHPNIVSLIDAGRDAGGLTYLAMEYVDGKTFRDALKQGALSLTEILEVFVQTCDALMEAHAAGIIHRDLKFDNIMLTRHRDARLHIKILDFGVAKLLSRNLNLTRSGQVPGTPGIIAPELIDERPPTPQSDLYSLGVLLFTALSGEAPFTAENDLELMRAHKFKELPRLEELVSHSVPRELIAVAYDLLAKEPEQRPADARAVRDRFETIARQLRASGYVDTYEPVNSEYELRDPDTSEQYFEGADEIDTGRWPVEREDERSAVERFIRAFFGEQPVVAPTTVVVVLAILLFALILTIVYVLIPDMIALFDAAPGS